MDPRPRVSGIEPDVRAYMPSDTVRRQLEGPGDDCLAEDELTAAVGRFGGPADPA